jgi:hypothetical protein
LEFFNSLFHLYQMVFDSRALLIFANHHKISLFLHLPKVDSPTGGVAEELLPALLKGKEQTPLTLLRTARNEFSHREGLAGSGGTGDQNHRILEEPTATHAIHYPHFPRKCG